MKPIRQYDSEAAAYIDKGYLESNGIKCMVSSDALSSVFPAPGAGTGVTSLYCEADKTKEAETLLKNRK